MEKQDVDSNPCSVIYLLCNLHSNIHPLTGLLAKLILIQGLYTLWFPLEGCPSLRYHMSPSTLGSLRLPSP